MAFDNGLAEIMRADLADMSGVVEKKMFGGLCFMMNGNMLCGVHTGGGMYRVGKANQATALAIPGVSPMAFTGRPMGGMIDVSEDVLANDTRRAQCLALALEFVGPMPAK